MSAAPIRAFPSSSIDPSFGGMALRDWFAGQIAAQTFAGPPAQMLGDRDERYNGTNWDEVVAANAYEMADGLMAEREKREAPLNRADKLKLVLLQYRNDMLYPPDADSRGRRIAMVDATLANLGIEA